MKLSVIERVMLANILPKEGTFANLRLLRVVKEEISFSEEENKALDFEQDGDQLKWKFKIEEGKLVDLIPEKEVAIGEVVTKLISKELNSLNSKAKLTEQHFSLYEKFIDIE